MNDKPLEGKVIQYSDSERELVAKCADIVGLSPEWLLHMLDCDTCEYDSGCGCCGTQHTCDRWYMEEHDGKTRQEVEAEKHARWVQEYPEQAAIAKAREDKRIADLEYYRPLLP
jgi:hypothetical protein